jgi:hypothetical protein
MVTVKQGDPSLSHAEEQIRSIGCSKERHIAYITINLCRKKP